MQRVMGQSVAHRVLSIQVGAILSALARFASEHTLTPCFTELPISPSLSLQSHVVHGCVGNRAAVLPLQLLGVETDVLNTVQYSNHVGYGSFAGEKLTGDQVWELLSGMHRNGLLSPTRLLTGFMGSAEAVRAVVRALPLLKQQGQGDFQFWCDPVLGDNGRLYVPRPLVDAYRDEVVPHAHALLPNQF
jgi:pyridoxine kinase